jgi:predicted acylesterase/phospholipase RssA
MITSQLMTLSRFVCVTRSVTVGTTLLSSYHSRRYPPDPKIRVWEAALATCAASSFFDPISIGRHKIEYVDGATGANNPVRYIWREAMDIWGSHNLDDRVDCLVSIGTGVPGARRFGDSVLEIARTLKEIATDTQSTANEFHSEHSGMSTSGRYFRFNVQRGLEDIGLEQSDRMPEVAAATSAYLEEEQALLAAEGCARRLSMHSG